MVYNGTFSTDYIVPQEYEIYGALLTQENHMYIHNKNEYKRD